ncbi:MAG: tetratricopeptide repeat protein [Lachnospiraceae bacterium]
MATIKELIERAQATNSKEVYEEIARMYFFGKGVQKDQSQALEYYKKAADLGSVYAQTCVGIMYYKGYGVSKNIKLAKQYLQPAADRGSIDALRNLGWMCYNGEYGFLTGKGKAFSYWMKASKLGDAESQIYVATSYLGDTWGEEQSNRKAAYWFMCAYQNRKATDNQIKEAKTKLDMLSSYVNLNAVKDEVVRKHPEYLNL